MRFVCGVSRGDVGVASAAARGLVCGVASGSPAFDGACPRHLAHEGTGTTMHDSEIDRARREAAGALTRAIRALEDAGDVALAAEAFVLANRVLRARQPQRTTLPTEATTI